MSKLFVLRLAAILILGGASYSVVRLALAEPLRDETLRDLERAAVRDPANAARFERLGQQAEAEGDLQLAERSLLRAAELSRLYQPRYLLAQYYFRRNAPREWGRWSREAFAWLRRCDAACGPRVAHEPDGAAMVEQALTERPLIARQFLFFLVRTKKRGRQRNWPAIWRKPAGRRVALNPGLLRTGPRGCQSHRRNGRVEHPLPAKTPAV